jgi:predicted amidophosphoribosyltransferase
MEKFKNAWEKLKREWKTFTVALVTAVVFAWDALIAQGFDFAQLISDKYRAWFGLAMAMLMLALRKYTDPQKDDE